MTVLLFNMRLCRVCDEPLSDEALCAALAPFYPGVTIMIGPNDLVCTEDSGVPGMIAWRNLGNPRQRSEHFLWVLPEELENIVAALPGRIEPMSATDKFSIHTPPIGPSS